MKGSTSLLLAGLFVVLAPVATEAQGASVSDASAVKDPRELGLEGEPPLVLGGGGGMGTTPYVSSESCGDFSSISGAPGVMTLATVSGCDDCTELVNLPFSFSWFYDTPINAVQVSSNGQINIDSTDTDNNCCTPDPVEVGGAYTEPRIAVAQEDLNPSSGGTIFALDTGNSFIIEYSNVVFFSDDGNVEAQVELFPAGDVEIRWGNLTSVDDNIAVGLEDDTRAMPGATPAAGAPFLAGGIADFTALPANSCRRFTTAPTTLEVPTVSGMGLALLILLLAAASVVSIRRFAA